MLQEDFLLGSIIYEGRIYASHTDTEKIYLEE